MLMSYLVKLVVIATSTFWSKYVYIEHLKNNLSARSANKISYYQYKYKKIMKVIFCKRSRLYALYLR